MSYRRSAAAYTRGQVHELLELFPEVSHLAGAVDQVDDIHVDTLFLEAMSYLAQTMGDSQTVLQEFFRRKQMKQVEAEKAARQSAGVRFQDDEARTFDYMETQALKRAGIRGESLTRATTPADQVHALLRGLLSSTGAGSTSVEGGDDRGDPRYHQSERRSRDHHHCERSRIRSPSPSRRESRMPSSTKRSTYARRMAQEIQTDMPSPVVLPNDLTTPINPPRLSLPRNRIPNNAPQKQQQQRYVHRAPRVSYDMVGTVAQQATCRDPEDLRPNIDAFSSLKARASSGMPPRTQHQSLVSSLSARPRYQGQQQQQYLRQTRPIRMDAPAPNEHTESPPMSSNGSVGRLSVTSDETRSTSRSHTQSPNSNLVLTVLSSNSYEVMDQQESAKATFDRLSSRPTTIPFSRSESSSVYIVEDDATNKPIATKPPLPTPPSKQIQTAAAIMKNEMLMQSRGIPLMDASTATNSTPPTHVSEGNSNLSLQYHRSSTSDSTSPGYYNNGHGTPSSREERQSNSDVRQRGSFGNTNLSLPQHQSSSSPSTSLVENEYIPSTPQGVTASSENSSLGLQHHSRSPMTSRSHHSRRSTESKAFDSPTGEKVKSKSEPTGDCKSQGSHRTRNREPKSFDSPSTTNSHPNSLDSPSTANLKPRPASIGDCNSNSHNHLSLPAPSGSEVPRDPSVDSSYLSSTEVPLQLGSKGNSALSLQHHYSSPAPSNSSRSESKLSGAVKDAKSEHTGNVAGQSLVEKAQAAFWTNKQKSFESASSANHVSASVISYEQDEKSEKSEGSFGTLIHAIRKSANKLTDSEPKKELLSDPPELAGFISIPRDPDAQRRGEPKIEFAQAERNRERLQVHGAEVELNSARKQLHGSGKELNTAKKQVHGYGGSFPYPVSPEISEQSEDSSPGHREPPESSYGHSQCSRSRREPGGRKFVDRRSGSARSNYKQNPRQDVSVSSEPSAKSLANSTEDDGCNDLGGRESRRDMSASVPELSRPESSFNASAAVAPGVDMSASVPELSRPESSFNTSAAVASGVDDSEVEVKTRRQSLKPGVHHDRDSFQNKQERSGKNDLEPAHHPTIDDADDLQILRRKVHTIRDSFQSRHQRSGRNDLHPAQHRRVPSAGDETASRTLHNDRDSFHSNQQRSRRNDLDPTQHPSDEDDTEYLQYILRRNPSAGEETASRKELLLQTKTTERTHTTLDVMCSEKMRERRDQQEQHHTIVESSSSVSSLSVPFAVKQKKQRSQPGTRKEKKKYYRSRGNPAFKTYESIRHHGSKSVGSYSTWETTDKERLVPAAPRKDCDRSPSTSRVKSSSDFDEVHDITSSASESSSSATVVKHESIRSCSSRVKAGHDFVEVCVLSSNSSESSASTAIEDIIVRCQNKLKVQRHGKPQKYW